MRPPARPRLAALLAGAAVVAASLGPMGARPAAATTAPAAERPAAGATVDDLDDLRADREAVEGDLGAITAEYEAIAVRLGDARLQRERLAEDLAALERAARRAERLLAARAATAYRQAGQDDLVLVLASAGPAEAVERARLLDSMGRREAGQLEQAQAARAAYAQRREALAALVAQLEADEARVAVLRAELDGAFRDARAREMEVATRRDRQRQVSRSGQEGTYACPIAPPFHFRDTWGAPRSEGRTHKGVDIFGEMGADVYAVTAGTVVRHSNNRLGGIGLYLLGDDGNQYYYAHLLRILPEYEPGRRVEAGELIAANGDTGNALGGPPHIHLEVRPGGGANVNPYPYVAAPCF